MESKQNLLNIWACLKIAPQEIVIYLVVNIVEQHVNIDLSCIIDSLYM